MVPLDVFNEAEKFAKVSELQVPKTLYLLTRSAIIYFYITLLVYMDILNV